jgi:hypothetical protein
MSFSQMTARGQALSALEIMSSNEVSDFLSSLEAARQLPDLKRERQTKIDRLGALDLTFILQLNQEIGHCAAN